MEYTDWLVIPGFSQTTTIYDDHQPWLVKNQVCSFPEKIILTQNDRSPKVPAANTTFSWLLHFRQPWWKSLLVVHMPLWCWGLYVYYIYIDILAINISSFWWFTCQLCLFKCLLFWVQTQFSLDTTNRGHYWSFTTPKLLSSPRCWPLGTERGLRFFSCLPSYTNHDPQLRIKYSSRFATRTARTQGIGQRGKKRAYLAQPKADWGQTWPSLALSWAEQDAELGPAVGLKLGAKRSRWTPNWRNAHGSPSHVQSGELGNLWRQLHTTLGPTETQHEEHCFKRSVIDRKKCENTSENKRFEDFGLGPLCLPFWSDMDYGLRSWAKVTALLAEAGPKWSRCCGHIGSKRCIWTILYGGAKRANYHGENLLFGARSILKMPAPSWSCTSEQKIVRIDRLFGAGNFCVACVADRTSADRNSSRKRSNWFWNKTAGPRSATSFMWNVTKRKGLPQLVKMKHFCPGVLGAALFWICGLDEKRKPWNLVWLCHVQHKDLK